ncbi:hypothetical protein BH11PLA1_BH11PLA1_18480 [soil metagenome]
MKRAEQQAQARGSNPTLPTRRLQSAGQPSLTTRQQDAITALLIEPTVARAAEGVKVPLRTLYRWLQSPQFAQAYREARRMAFAHAVAQTQRCAPLAVNTLARIASDPDAPAHARVAAAGTLLRFGREAMEVDDLAARVELLEGTGRAALPLEGTARVLRREDGSILRREAS